MATFAAASTTAFLSPDIIEGFVEDQAFLQSYDWAPRLPPSPLFPQQVVSLSQSTCVTTVVLTMTGGGGVGEEPNHTTRKSLALYKSCYMVLSVSQLQSKCGG